MNRKTLLTVAALSISCFALPAFAQSQSGAPRTVAATRNAPSNGGYFNQGPTEAELAEMDAHSKAINALIEQGRVQIKKGQNDAAIALFRQILAGEHDSGAYKGLVEAYIAKGELRNAASVYRELVYPDPKKKWSSNASTDPATLMRFALVLNKIGEKDEALTVYRQGLHYLNYDGDGKPNTSHLMLLELPFDNSNADNVYSPARLEAAAHTAIAMGDYLNNDQESAKKELNQALVAQPRFGPAWFYKALVLQRLSFGDRSIKKEEVSAAFDNAEQLVHGGSAKAIVKAQRKEYNF